MIENHFFLAAGLIALFFPLGHGFWIQKNVVREMESTQMHQSTQHSIFVFLHYTTATLFLSAVALIVISTFSDAGSAIPLALFVAAINAGNLLIFIGAGLARNRKSLVRGVPQIFFMLVWLGIIVAGL